MSGPPTGPAVPDAADLSLAGYYGTLAEWGESHPSVRVRAMAAALRALVAARPPEATVRQRDTFARALRSIAAGYDHEADAHRYNNGSCRVCIAEAALAAPIVPGEQP